MTKYICTLCLCIIALTRAQAQSIPNPGFESWITAAGYDDPSSWVTINQLSAAPFSNPVSVFQMTGVDAHSGLYGLEVKTVQLTNNPLPSVLPNILGPVFTGAVVGATNIINGYPYSGHPDTLNFFYKYFPEINDTGLVYVSFQRHDDVNDTTLVLGTGRLEFDSTCTNWTLVSLPITWTSTDIPDTAAINFFSSGGGGPIPDSYLILDDLWYSDVPPTVSQIEGDTLNYDLVFVTPPVEVSSSIVAWNDTATINGASVKITNNFVSSEDSLMFTPMFGITGSYSAATGVLMLSGSATYTQYTTLLRSVSYKNHVAVPTQSVRKVTFDVNDGMFTSNIGVRYVRVYNSTGISSLDEKNSLIKVFPSPAKDIISVSGIPAGANKIEIYDLLGTRVMESLCNDNKTAMIDVAKLPSGMYVLSIPSGTSARNYNKTFVVNK